MDEIQYLEINDITRMINVPANLLLGVREDKDVKKLYFKCKKIVEENVDLSKHQIYVKYINALDKSGKKFDIMDPKICLCGDVTTQGDYITFSWLMSENVFAKAGLIAFSILASDGEKTRWNTYTAIGTVLNSVPGGLQEIAGKYPDIITQLLNRMREVEKIATKEAMQEYVNTYLTEHPGKIDETLTDPKKAAPADVVGSLKEDLICLKGNVWNAVTDGGCDNTGVADCTDIVQSAINEAPDCSVLYFPKGNYLFNRNLVIEQKKGLKICGDGRGWYGTLFTVKYDYSFIIIYGGEKITLENFSIKGNGYTTSRAIAFLDNTPTTMECRTCDTMVKNISITRFSSGIELSCPSGYNYFENISISMFPSNGIGFGIGSVYDNTGTTDGWHTILPNYVYFTNCNVDGNNDNSYKIDGLCIKAGQYVVIDKCDFCNSHNGINIINNNTNGTTVCDVYVNNTSLYNNQNGVTIDPFANGIERISINNCMIVTNGKQYSYALSVYKRDGVDFIKNISFIGNIMRDYSGVNRKYFNV